MPLALRTQDVPEQRSMEYPKLYEPGQLNLLFNKREFFICIAQGIYTSVLMFFIPYGAFAEATRDDGTQLADYQSFAVTVATSLVIVVSVQVGGSPGTGLPSGRGGAPVLEVHWALQFCSWEGGLGLSEGGVPSACNNCFSQIGLDTGYWTAINHFFIWGSLAVYFAILFAMHSNGLFDMFPNQFRFVGECLWLPLASVRNHSCSGTNGVGRHLFNTLYVPGILQGAVGI